MKFLVFVVTVITVGMFAWHMAPPLANWVVTGNPPGPRQAGLAKNLSEWRRGLIAFEDHERDFYATETCLFLCKPK